MNVLPCCRTPLLCVVILAATVASALSASAAPLYLKFPLGVETEFTLTGPAGSALSGKTDMQGQFYAPQSPPPGEYRLEFQDPDGSRTHAVAVSIADKKHGLALVLRPDVPWSPSAQKFPEKQRRSFMSPKVLVLIMMLCCLCVMALILHRKGILAPLLARMSRRAPEEGLADTDAQAPRGPVPAKAAGHTATLTGSVGLDDFKRMEKALAKGKCAYTLAGERISAAVGWDGELGDIVLTRQRHVGGVGAVYEAYGTKEKNRRLAVKLPLSTTLGKSNNAFDIESIKTEFDNNRSLSGSMRLIQFYELRALEIGKNGQSQRAYYSIMEYFDGLSLRDVMGMGRDFDLYQRRIVMREVLEALAEAHSKNKLHNDIKPENILVQYNTRSKSVTGVKLIDFGAQVEVRRDDPQRARKLTPDYSAPEVLGGSCPTNRSDIYAAGLLFYELFEGALPFPSGKGMESNVSPEEFDLRFKALASQQALQRIIRNMLVKQDAARPYRTVSAVLDELRSA
ncbi:serine/threonine-protein kinase [Paucidesulfovibrio longus]|uniref:serine/threonine-protein kinase n=1 Tax=Paucidesulfovibrio longus TaxID=889 RepID=UPI0003B3E5B3|nr:serine/threonine-protein kinase [Paucidesulfovibrio longus]